MYQYKICEIIRNGFLKKSFSASTSLLDDHIFFKLKFEKSNEHWKQNGTPNNVFKRLEFVTIFSFFNFFNAVKVQKRVYKLYNLSALPTLVIYSFEILKCELTKFLAFNKKKRISQNNLKTKLKLS